MSVKETNISKWLHGCKWFTYIWSLGVSGMILFLKPYFSQVLLSSFKVVVTKLSLCFLNCCFAVKASDCLRAKVRSCWYLCSCSFGWWNTLLLLWNAWILAGCWCSVAIFKNKNTYGTLTKMIFIENQRSESVFNLRLSNHPLFASVRKIRVTSLILRAAEQKVSQHFLFPLRTSNRK